jgi:hypothetical protein
VNQEEVLTFVLDTLERCGIASMVTGSFAGNLHGLPRATQDADVVVAGGRLQFEQFVAELGSDFYASRDAALDAFDRQGMFNVIHLDSGFKVDLIVRKTRPFSREEFARRRVAEIAGRPRWFATPEDVILSKLEWSRLGNSERQYLDALNVARVQGEALDRAYLRRWTAELGVGDLLERLFAELGV